MEKSSGENIFDSWSWEPRLYRPLCTGLLVADLVVAVALIIGLGLPGLIALTRIIHQTSAATP